MWCGWHHFMANHCHHCGRSCDRLNWYNSWKIRICVGKPIIYISGCNYLSIIESECLLTLSPLVSQSANQSVSRSLQLARTSCWINTLIAGGLRLHDAHVALLISDRSRQRRSEYCPRYTVNKFRLWQVQEIHNFCYWNQFLIENVTRLQ